MKLSQAKTTLVLLFVLATASGCGVINSIRSKNELNEGARAYKAGHFDEAQKRFEKALELNPEQKNAPFFIARSIHAQYRPGVEAPENVAKANQAIEAYQKVLANDPNNEEAFNAIVYLYRQLKLEDKEREWLTRRASLESVSPEKRAEAYTVMASKEWNCSYAITEQKENKKTVMKDGNAIIQYVKPKEQGDLDQAKQCVARGLELANKAISLNPNSEQAWSYKTNLLLEQSKFAEMEGNTEQKAQFDREYREAQEQTTRLSNENKRRKEEEEAKKSPSPPAG